GKARAILRRSSAADALRAGSRIGARIGRTARSVFVRAREASSQFRLTHARVTRTVELRAVTRRLDAFVVLTDSGVCAASAGVAQGSVVERRAFAAPRLRVARSGCADSEEVRAVCRVALAEAAETNSGSAAERGLIACAAVRQRIAGRRAESVRVAGIDGRAAVVVVARRSLLDEMVAGAFAVAGVARALVAVVRARDAVRIELTHGTAAVAVEGVAVVAAFALVELTVAADGGGKRRRARDEQHREDRDRSEAQDRRNFHRLSFLSSRMGARFLGSRVSPRFQLARQRSPMGRESRCVFCARELTPGEVTGP